MKVENLVSNAIEEWTFDYVIVATGHYHCPNMPHFQGISDFPGRVLHVHDFRGADEFANQRLLLIGAGDSAEDIAVQCFKFKARSIVISYRSYPMDFIWPDNIRQVPLLQRMVGKRAYFKDGSNEEVDAIIFCTGYRHDFSFMDESLRLQCPDACFYPPLYKGIFWIKQPRLIYLGMQSISLLRLDVQAILAHYFILGCVTLPSVPEMESDVHKWCARVASGFQYVEPYFEFHRDYLKDLLETCAPNAVPKIDVDRLYALEMKVETTRLTNIFTYRDHSYPSIYTDVQAPKHRIAWLENMDDSLDGFLGRSTDGDSAATSSW